MKTLQRGLIALCCFGASIGNAQFPNHRIFPSTITQTEPVITVHPTDPLTMFASARTVNTNGGFQSEGVYVTTNGGTTWFGSDTCRGENIFNHGGDPGIGIYPNGTLILTHIGNPILFQGVYSHFSTDLGATWSNAATIFFDANRPPDDKGQTTVIDNHPSSTFFGRVHAAWTIVGSPYSVYVSHSTNGAQSWSTPVTINSPPPSRCSGAFANVAGDGKVYVCWAGLEDTFPFVEDFVGVATSTDGGNNWSVTQNAYDINGIKGTLPAKSNILVNGLPQLEIDRSNGPRNGWVYIATTEKNLSPAGSDPDIILHRSTDGGTTWSAGIRVNQDPVNNGKTQYFPAIDVDYQGGVNIIFYDDRNTSSDSAEVFLARSEDGGGTWTEQVISDHRFKPKPIAGFASGYQGDHIAITSVNNMLYPFWMDDYAGIYQVWSATIDIRTLGVEETHLSLPNSTSLKQNYPNPFNPSTIIEYTLGTNSFVSLVVLDVTGREIARLVNTHQMKGNHRVVFSSESMGLSSGIYFYRLSANGMTMTKTMVFIK